MPLTAIINSLVSGSSSPLRIFESDLRGESKGSWPWCDDTLGCLDINDDWSSFFKRPVNFVPSSRKKIGTEFYIHTRKNRNYVTNHEVVAYQASTFNGTGFDASKPTKFIIHGFIDNGNVKWLKEMAQELLDYGDYNVFRVNWGGGSLTIYGKATANTRVVGLEIGYLVNWMINYFSLDPAKVHLIGHSLGSHVSGYAGEQITGLGRISGLDPAGPYFTGMPSFVRLDETDAIFVDNYHTDGASIVLLGFGTRQAIGNIDFYPNGGRIQPGCGPSVITSIIDISVDDLYGDLTDIVSCSHARVIDIYRDTLKQPCPYIAHECDDYDDFEDGDCESCGDDNQRCSPIGIRASDYNHKERVNVKLYFDTDQEAPYCCKYIGLFVQHLSKRNKTIKSQLNLWSYCFMDHNMTTIKITSQHE
ncbi:unnamed protein product, partial [Meganyctiphanes norvegica]